MDAAYKNPTRMFPGYTLAELKASVARYEAADMIDDVAHYNKIKTEVANRESGKSVHFVVPQIGRLLA